jgi:Zn ribbon nucleic-acid-binding protein
MNNENNNILKCVCPICWSSDTWKIINDNGILVGVCKCGHTTILGIANKNYTIENKTSILN